LTNEIKIYKKKTKRTKSVAFFLSRHEKQFLDIMPNERRRVNLLRYVSLIERLQSYLRFMYALFVFGEKLNEVINKRFNLHTFFLGWMLTVC
jgi:hypothetical protein